MDVSSALSAAISVFTHSAWEELFFSDHPLNPATAPPSRIRPCRR